VLLLQVCQQGLKQLHCCNPPSLQPPLQLRHFSWLLLLLPQRHYCWL
jgi:hypothetical protein